MQLTTSPTLHLKETIIGLKMVKNFAPHEKVARELLLTFSTLKKKDWFREKIKIDATKNQGKDWTRAMLIKGLENLL
jgi:hypothetical protein